jgi:SAM-dependent methyltransferase
MEPRERQEAQYDFPYHYLLSQDQPNIWRVARYLHWGYEYFTVLDAVVNMVSHYQPKRLLDFGCGDGRLIRDLTNRSPDLEVIGVDRSERALAFAEAILHGKPKVRLVTGLSRIDRTLLPVEAVMAMEVLEHIPPLDLKPLTEELQAVLSPYGIFIVTVPSLNIPLNKKHYQHFSLESLNSYMAGLFECIEHRYVHKSGLAWELVRKMVANRFFIANNESWLKLATCLYRRCVMNATAETGAHIVAVFKPIVEGATLCPLGG